MTKLAIVSILFVTWSTIAPVISFGAGPSNKPGPKVVSKGPTRVTAGRLATFVGSGPLTVLGVTWAKGSAHGQLDIRARYQASGAWSSWTNLGAQPDASEEEAPAARRRGAPAERAGTEPIVVGQATGYEVQVSVKGGGLPKDLQVVSVDASQTGAPPTSPANSASAEGTRPWIYSRADWGADESKRNCTHPEMPSVKAVAVHHTAGNNGYTASQVPSIINGIYTYHTSGLGWCDIGYNVLVDRFGRLWEGRGGGLDRNVQPAAQMGFNMNTSAISALGNYSTSAAPSAMVDAIARFASWRLGLAHVDPKGSTTLISQGGSGNRYSYGQTVRLPTIFAHRDVGYTECPGDNLYAAVPTIRSKARAYSGSAAIFDPSINFWRMSTNDLPAFRINGSTASSQQVALQVTNAATGALVYSATTSSLWQKFSVIWDKRDAGGVVVPPGTYVMRVTSTSATASALPYSTTVQVTGTPVPPGDPAPEHPVNRTPGYFYTGTHAWFTSCGAYSTATRCYVQIYSSRWKRNNWAYTDQGYSSWQGNRLAVTGRWSDGVHAYSTNCSPNVATGARSCRTVVWDANARTWVIDSMVWLGDGR
ncbi:hypothetical protein N864_06380 [Intrasporangium chromatireducens Q5-1]|uniref:N-acetylmuramoyl-L-alanine amidase n=1 Tax=Intrasporangium chromatireducens Q5-1 TaxID=584657 RepID=W9GN55_9MICO|nr:hypothetical protein N864_06380 [Intrasporangium chromatireducens Q5-1]